jgi:predicted DNA-binding protein
MKQLDVRGFEYGLEPLVRRQRWRVAAHQLKLARLQDSLARCVADQEQLERTRRECGEQVLQRAQARLDPATHRHALLYLVALRERHASGERMLTLLREQRQVQQAAGLEMQRRLELLEQHKGEALAAWLRERQQRHEREMDRDWLARRVWRAAQATDGNGFEEKLA